ncbi:MAG: SpoIIE family protein phosphatase [Planctomycetes bacterium]|nr:SpoIIE family protein phosphatase [Planctomycetota bacterium]
MTPPPQPPITPLPAQAPAPGTAAGPAPTAPAAPATPPAPIASPPSLTDFLDLPTLQELQDNFAVLAHLKTVIRDAQGNPLTAPTDTTGRSRSDALLEELIGPDDAGEQLHAPIIVEGRELGSVSIESAERPEHEPDRDRLIELCERLGVPHDQVPALLYAAERAFAPRRGAAVQVLFLLANHLARLCYQEFQLRERVNELAVLNRISTLLTGHRDLQQLLDTAARSCAEAMGLKAAAIRLLDDSGQELVIKAVHGLSAAYLNKGPILLDNSQVAKTAFSGQVVYVEDMLTDPRVIYPEDAEREGLSSFLVAPMIYRGRPIGIIQVYSAERRKFSTYDVNLLQSIAQLTGTAIETARLDAQRKEAVNVQRQLRLAADVQQRMLPASMPEVPPFDIAARYVPSFDLGGDFYDFIQLDSHLGIAVADVVGKGVAASLLMASVRASLRAYAQDVYDIDEVLSRVNAALCRDTLSSEFVTLFYGVLDPSTLRLTYCNAGHEPPLLLRKGEVIKLDVGGTVVGIDPDHHYDKGLIDLLPGDTLLIYTDGLCDAQDFNNRRFGRERVRQSLVEAAKLSAGDALNHILWQMRRFVGLNKRMDDLTMVVIKVKPAGKPRKA